MLYCPAGLEPLGLEQSSCLSLLKCWDCRHAPPYLIFSFYFFVVVFVFEIESRSVSWAGVEWRDLRSLQPLPPGFK